MKWILFTGIALLTLGIAVNYSIEKSWPVALIIAGVGLKVLYVVIKMVKNRYRPGGETGFLVAGLLLFFTGLYLSPHANTGFISLSTLFKLSGIALKIIFVLLFMRKIKSY